MILADFLLRIRIRSIEADPDPADQVTKLKRIRIRNNTASDYNLSPSVCLWLLLGSLQTLVFYSILLCCLPILFFVCQFSDHFLLSADLDPGEILSTCLFDRKTMRGTPNGLVLSCFWSLYSSFTSVKISTSFHRIAFKDLSINSQMIVQVLINY